MTMKITFSNGEEVSVGQNDIIRAWITEKIDGLYYASIAFLPSPNPPSIPVNLIFPIFS